MAFSPSYLRKRKDRSSWRVRVPTPAPLRSLRDVHGKLLFGDYVEKVLGTPDKRRAQDLARGVVDEIKRLFARAKQGRVTAEEIKQFRESELRQGFDHLASDMVENLDRLPTLSKEIDADSDLPLAWYYRRNPLLNHETAVEHATRYAKSIGAIPDRESVEELATGALKSLSVAVAMIQRGMTPPPLPGHRVKRHGSAIAVSEAGKRWLADMMRDGDEQWSQQTKLQHSNTLRLFVDFTKDAPLDAITRADASAFRETIGKLNPKYGQHKGSNKKPLVQLLKEFPGRLTNRTLKRHMSALNLLFAWCIHSGLLPEGHANPFTNMQKREKTRRGVRKLDAKNPTGYLPYNDEELRALFSRHGKLEAQTKFSVEPKKHSTQTALLWVGLVSVYSGLRQNEIAGLLTTDVREAEGIPFFAIEEHEEHEGHRVKNDNAVRHVPVHSRLVELGFLRYVAHVRKQGHDYLFPGLKAGGPDRKRNTYFTKAWTAYARARGATRARTCFHSLRSNLISKLEGHAHASQIAALVGHYRGFTFSNYAKDGPSLATLREIVEKAGYQLEMGK